MGSLVRVYDRLRNVGHEYHAEHCIAIGLLRQLVQVGCALSGADMQTALGLGNRLTAAYVEFPYWMTYILYTTIFPSGC